MLGAVGAAGGAWACAGRRTETGCQPVAGDSSSAHGVAPARMLRTPVFWLMFVMMTMMSTGGLMVISQLGAFAKDFGVADVTVFGMAALPLALTARPLHQRADAAVLRLAVRPDRPREHHAASPSAWKASR